MPLYYPCFPSAGSNSLWLVLRRDSPNNYGAIIPKGCIRSRRALHDEVGTEPAQGFQGAGRRRALMRRFLERNPHVVATAHDIGLRPGVEQSEAQRELAELERTGEARQVMRGLWHKGKPAARRRR